jgi:hypothetical protein
MSCVQEQPRETREVSYARRNSVGNCGSYWLREPGTLPALLARIPVMVLEFPQHYQRSPTRLFPFIQWSFLYRRCPAIMFTLHAAIGPATLSR